MRALITGAKGTVGRALSAHLAARGCDVAAWDRQQVPVDSYHAMEAFVRRADPDVIFHLAIASQPTGKHNEGWLVNYHWPSELAWIARSLGVRFVFTSTAMVFSNDAKGPFTPKSEPDAPEGYGLEKRRAEARVFFQNPGAHVVRLGWQIGETEGSNNMVDYLWQKHRHEGVIRASTKWLPACSFLQDTAAALEDAASMPPGLYHVDSNTGWNFFEIATAINSMLGKPWKVEPTEDFVYDQRLLDPRLKTAPLLARLALPPLEAAPHGA
jgi:dTDP-4-dehydrorhamnose reductase